MATLTDTDYTNISTSAAETFVSAYYTAIDASRNTIKQYYVPTSMPPSGRGLPSVTYNGELVVDASLLQDRFVKEMPWTHHDVQSLNVHVLNPSLTPDAKSRKEAEKNMSLIVQVSGYVRLVERKEGPMRGFSDSFVLVPNKEETGGRGTGKQGHGQQWLIQSQTFRYVV